MENLKVKVNNKSESKEAQELFVELGYMVVNNIDCEKGYIVASKNAESPINFDYWHDVKNIITIQQLHDLVVLNRNDVADATHTDGHYSFYVGKDKNYFFSSCDKAWRGTWKNVDTLKPIEKPMKEPKQAEFLVKTDSGYVLQVLDENSGGADVVRVPDGADTLAGDYNYCYFWQHGADKKHLLIGCGSSLERYPNWTDCKDYADEWLSNFDGDNSLRILWQHETLNDQVASAEEYREMISNASILGRSSVVADIAQSCSGGAIRNASSQGQSEFPLNNYELNHRVAKAFNAVRGTNLNEDDVNYIRELIDLTISHYGERK